METERGSGYQGDIAIDDISFVGCQRFTGVLPTAAPTTTRPPTTPPCNTNQFYCIKDKKCIDRKYKCDYKRHCSDGLDEEHCGTFFVCLFFQLNFMSHSFCQFDHSEQPQNCHVSG